MQAPGGGHAVPSSSSWMASLSLDFLGAEELMGQLGDVPFLDPATLLAVCSSDHQPQQQGSASGSMQGPTGLQQPQHQAGVKRQAPADAGSGDDSDEDECRGGKTGSGGGKRGKGDTSNAARVKASKEKARRGKINDRFAELARLIEPGGSEPKTDKPSILADAIKYVQQLTVENHQLRQLNKFLEERVGNFERERGHNLYQQSLMMQGGGSTSSMMQPQQSMMPQPQGMMQPQQGMMQPQQSMMPAQQQSMMPAQQQGMLQPHVAMMPAQQQGMMQPPQHGMLQQQQPPMMPVQAQLGGMRTEQQITGQSQGQSSMPPMMAVQQAGTSAGMMPAQQPLMQAGMVQMQAQPSTTGSMGSMGSGHMQAHAMPGQLQPQQMGYQPQPQQQQYQQQLQQPQQQAHQMGYPQQQQQGQVLLKTEPSIDNSSQQSGSRQAASVEGESAPAATPAASAVSPQPVAMVQAGAQQQYAAPGQIPAAGPYPGAHSYYYPSGLKPSIGPVPTMAGVGMQAMPMGAAPALHWPNMGVDSAQQDSLLRPPVA